MANSRRLDIENVMQNAQTAAEKFCLSSQEQVAFNYNQKAMAIEVIGQPAYKIAAIEINTNTLIYQSTNLPIHQSTSYSMIFWKDFKSVFISLVLIIPIVFGCDTRLAPKPNVLFIAVDDLRPELGCYGKEYIQSPNIDRLASEGIVFANHYANVPTCGASRYTLLTGMLPRKPSDVGNDAIHKAISGKAENPRPESFIHQLKKNGYYTIGIGKISHYADGLLYGYTDDTIGAERELPHSWNEMVFDPGKWGTGWNAFFGYADGSNRQSRKRQVKPYENADVPDEGFPDGLTTNLAIKKLREMSEKQKTNSELPFFLGVGFFKPHLPFNSPKKYWDMYNESEIPLSASPDLPEDVALASLHASGEFNGYALGEEKASLKGSVSEDYARKVRHAYFAAISYTDAQIGKLLNELESLELSNNTIVVVWGDHGWHLGDHRVWGKHTLFDFALQSALIIKLPGDKQEQIKYVDKTVSTIDIYPTLMELCGIEMPHETDGKSLVSLWENPEFCFDNQAFGYFRKGVSLRTDRYRLTRYFREADPQLELYDHITDPYESENIARKFPNVVDSLRVIWERGNTGVYK